MKIIAVDNLNRESVSDRLVCENIHSMLEGKCMQNALNQQFAGPHSSAWYRLVEDDHQLFVVTE